MEPKNNLHSQNNSNTGGPFLANSAVSGGASDSNNADIFSTLCNLATTTNNSGFNSQSQLLFPNIQNEWNNNSNNWFDQAKLSLFPMYGLLQANNNNTNEFSHSSMGTDRNLHHQTSNNFIQSAPPFNLVENLQSSFGLLYNNNTMTNTTLANPLQSPPGIMQQHLMHQQSPLKHNISNYSHSTASDSDCTPHSNPPSSNLSHQLIISPTQPSSIIEDHQLNNLHSSSQVEPLDEFMFDLQDFEEFFMETPSTSYQQQQHPMDPSTPFSQHSDCPMSNKPTDNISTTCGSLNNSICNKFCQEELANADKEVDRLVSMVAHKNNIQKDREAITTTNNSSGFHQHSIASLFSLNCSPSTSSSVLPQIPKTEASLEMPHFTPPDSPSPTSTTIAFDDHSTFNSSLNNTNQHTPQQLTTTSTPSNNQHKQHFGNSRHSSFGSSTSSNNAAALPSFSSPPKTTLKKSPLSFIPTNSTPQNQLIDPLKLNHLAMSRSKNNDKRIPIYKRNSANTTTNIGGGRSLSFIESFMKNEAGTKKDSSQTAEDAFNFDEDFDDKIDNNELIPLKSPQKMIHSQTDKQRLGEQEKAKRKYTKRKGIIEDSYTTATNNVLREVEHKQQPKARPLLAEQIKMRRPIGTFLNSEIAKDDNAAICEAVPTAVCTLKNVETSCLNNDTDFKPLPKLVIRILRRTESSTTTTELPPLLPTPTELNEVNNNFQQQQKHKKKKHKKNKKEKDVDWTETDECLKSISKKNKKHREHHKSKRRDSKGSIGSLDLNETENNNNISPEYTPTQHINNNNRRDSFSPEIYPGIPTTTTSSTSLQKEEEQINNFNEDSTSFSSNFCERLNFIERPTENPKKGTFLLAKEDLFKLEENSVALWRIDNQNLLQKYIPFVVEEEGEYKGEIHYKNSQTYSGWSPDFVDYHIVVRVEYIKKSRSDNIVRPLLPLQDLFPVVCSTINGAEDKSIVKVSQPEPLKQLNVKETQLIEHLKVFVEIMLKHAITLQFVQNIRENNDWNYLCSMTEIETKIKNCLQNICSENDRWLPSFLEALNNFPNIFFLRDFNDHKDEQQSCQACLLKCLDVNQAIQLYTEEVYDTETIVPKMLTNCENTVCNIDFYLCNKCADAALKYHKIYHLRYSIFKASEMKLELTSTEHPEYSVEQVIEQCKNDTEWVENLCIEGANVILSK